MTLRPIRLVVVASLLVSACGGDNVIGPSNQPEIANNRDSFQFQASDLRGTTQTLSYTWENTGSSANVNQSGRISGGTATLTLRDAAGTQVYTRDLATTGTFSSATGTPGNWRIEVRLVDVSGTLNFRLQKP